MPAPGNEVEACATAHYWARELTKLGHQVRLMPAKDVKAYVKHDKNDAADAEAIFGETGPVDVASRARSFDAATDPGNQCHADAYGRARYCVCAGAWVRSQSVVGRVLPFATGSVISSKAPSAM